MTWFRLDDQGAFHAKVVQAGNEAYGAWCRAGQWSSAQLTEGRITRATALAIAPLRVWKRLMEAKGTSEHGLVEAVGEDFQIHDFLDWNPSAAEELAKRAARSAAGRTGGQKSAASKAARAQAKPEAKAQAIASPFASANAKQNSTPSPIPSPSPIPKDDPDPRGCQDEATTIAQSTGRVVDLGSARCERACEVYASTLAELGWSRPPVRERWERQALCDAVNAHLRADGSVEGFLAELRRAVAEWVDAYGQTSQFTQGWGARKFSEWLTAGRQRSDRRPTATPRLLTTAAPLPTEDAGDYAPPTPEEAADLERAIHDLVDPTKAARAGVVLRHGGEDLPQATVEALESKRREAVKALRATVLDEPAQGSTAAGQAAS